MISKINTVAQILLAVFALANVGFDIVDIGISTVLVYLVAATTFISGAAYVRMWVQTVRHIEEEAK
jgi:phosphatidylglycerophosphate synthase